MTKNSPTEYDSVGGTWNATLLRDLSQKAANHVEKVVERIVTAAAWEAAQFGHYTYTYKNFRALSMDMKIEVEKRLWKRGFRTERGPGWDLYIFWHDGSDEIAAKTLENYNTLSDQLSELEGHHEE